MSELRDALVYINVDQHWVGWSSDAMNDMRLILEAARQWAELPELVPASTCVFPLVNEELLVYPTDERVSYRTGHGGD